MGKGGKNEWKGRKVMDKFMDGGSGGRINGLVDEKWVAGEKQGKQTG